MASIRKEISIAARPEDVWDALRDWPAVHERLAPGFVTQTRMDGEDRIVTFFNGAVAREVLVDLDDDARRLVWAVVGDPFTHYNGAAQVLAQREDLTRFVWVTDLLPSEAAARVDEMMERGIGRIKKTLEAQAVRV